jgi:hypothetical protein
MNERKMERRGKGRRGGMQNIKEKAGWNRDEGRAGWKLGTWMKRRQA